MDVEPQLHVQGVARLGRVQHSKAVERVAWHQHEPTDERAVAKEIQNDYLFDRGAGKRDLR
jgi:hypothetical protein